jgi:hypothetical protein
MKPQLNLILGIGRSGTTWIANTIARTRTPIRYLEEPLPHLIPRLAFNSTYDHTAIRHDQRHTKRLLTAYNCFLAESTTEKNFSKDKVLIRDDNNYEKVLVKEVHSLLAVERIQKDLNAKILFVKRDPLKIVDSLFYAQGLSTPYLCDESKYVKDTKFLKHFFKERSGDIEKFTQQASKVTDTKIGIASEKASTICLIQKIYENALRLNSNGMIVDYKEIVDKPDAAFRTISNFFDVSYVDGSFNFDSSKTETNSPYSIVRSTSSQLNKPLKYFEDSEAKAIENHISNLESLCCQ